MNDLIQIARNNINGSEVNSVNARDLHKCLSINSRFADWIKRQLDIFIEGEDFLKIEKPQENNTIDYILTLDTAKHISMLQKNDIGMQIRKYFIDVDKQSSLPALPQTYIEALEALTASEKEKLALSNKIIEKDKVILAVADLNIRAGDVTIGDFSKNLAIEGLGQNNLFSWLKGRGFLMMNTAPYQQYVERGYFVRKPSNKKINGEFRYTTMLTPKGTIWLTKMLKAEFDLE